ncbi:MAG: DUF2169 domain-containing protein [Polyangiaceae bacterium]|nr:DUF2169 domain-containing protein [Polyangiaceae bacterium]
MGISHSLPTSALGPVSVAALSWQLGGIAYVTATVKAVFELVPGGVARLAEPRRLLLADQITLPGPLVSAPRELVPSLTQPEVTLTARVHAPGAAETSVRLAVARADGVALIDKRLHVSGRAGREGEARDVDGLELDYLNALGGLGFIANPLGRGRGSSQDAPYVVDPRNPEVPASFSPVPPFFASRSVLLDTHGAKVVTGELALPQGFNARYFQAAPPDQRVDWLRGDERIVLEHMNAAHPVVDTTLPGLVAVARLYVEHGGWPLMLRLESIHIDAETLIASLVWRKTFPSPAPARPILAAQLEALGKPAEWPASVAADPSQASGQTSAASFAGTVQLSGPDSAPRFGSVTLALSTEDRGPASSAAPIPVERPASRPPAPPTPGAPWAGAQLPPIRPAQHAFSETLSVASAESASTPGPKPGAPVFGAETLQPGNTAPISLPFTRVPDAARPASAPPPRRSRARHGLPPLSLRRSPQAIGKPRPWQRPSV